jgi:hypothetical protein
MDIGLPDVYKTETLTVECLTEDLLEAPHGVICGKQVPNQYYYGWHFIKPLLPYSCYDKEHNRFIQSKRIAIYPLDDCWTAIDNWSLGQTLRYGETYTADITDYWFRKEKFSDFLKKAITSRWSEEQVIQEASIHCLFATNDSFPFCCGVPVEHITPQVDYKINRTNNTVQISLLTNAASQQTVPNTKFVITAVNGNQVPPAATVTVPLVDDLTEPYMLTVAQRQKPFLMPLPLEE